MSVAIRTITRLQDADDINVTLGAGVDEYALCWDNDTSKFVLRATTGYDHGLLAAASLGDDDHTQYALLAGRAGGQTLYGGTAANEDITIHGTSNSTRTTSYVLLQPSGGNVGIGTSTPAALLNVNGIGLFGAVAIPGSASANSRVIIAHDAANVGLDICGSAAGFPFADFNRARGTNASPAAVMSGDQLGAIIAGGYDGTATKWTSGIEWFVDDTVAASTIPTRIVFSTGTGASRIERMRIDKDGKVGIGQSAMSTAAAVLQVLRSSAITNLVGQTTILDHTSSGTPEAGFGASLLLRLKTSTTASTDAAGIKWIWNDATNATRKADLVLTAYDTAEREGLRIRGAGSAPAIGFLGATPQARVAHVADPAGGATVDAEARSAINSILSTLELFGLHATS